MSNYEIIQSDIIKWAKEYDGPPYMAMLLDPPYHLTSITKRFGKPDSAPAKGGVYNRASKGFMGSSWDGGSIAFDPETWAALASHLYPGAFIMAFAGTRGYHRMACAMEDAGLIIHPALGWVFLSGFPKATRIDTQIDRNNGREFADRYALGKHIKEQREKLGHTRAQVNQWLEAVTKCEHFESDSQGFARVPSLADWYILRDRLQLSDEWTPFVQRIEAEREVIGENKPKPSKGIYGEFGGNDITAPATDQARDWAGHRYGLQALKPAFEFIAVAQRPYEGRPVENIVATGAGSLWIDGGRIGTEERSYNMSAAPGGNGQRLHGGDGRDIDNALRYANESKNKPPAVVNGRWPSNLVLQHHPDCNGVCVPGGSFKLTAFEFLTFAVSPASEPSFLLDRLQFLIGAIQKYSKTDNSLLRDAYEFYRNGRKQSGDSLAGLTDEVECVLGLKELQDYQGGYQSYRRFCDEQLHRILTACQDGLPSLIGVLDCVYSDLCELLHNPVRQSSSPLSSLGDSRLKKNPVDTQENKNGVLDHSSFLLPLLDSDNRHKGQWEQQPTAHHANKKDDNTSVDDKRETLFGKTGKTEALRLLCWLSFDLASKYLLSDDIIQRLEIVVNFPACGVRALDEQSGELKSGGGNKYRVPRDGGYQGPSTYGVFRDDVRPDVEYKADSGPASRMFYRADWAYEVAEQLANATPLRYEPKASSTEREIGLDSLDTKTRNRVNSGGLENEPRFAPTQVKNNHPTVKAISLTKYLATLLLPPAAYAPRRILIPFSGVASECIGATLAGWEEVTGVEMSAEYCQIACRRLAWWSQWPGWGQTDVDKILAVTEEQLQPSLF